MEVSFGKATKLGSYSHLYSLFSECMSLEAVRFMEPGHSLREMKNRLV